MSTVVISVGFHLLSERPLPEVLKLVGVNLTQIS